MSGVQAVSFGNQQATQIGEPKKSHTGLKVAAGVAGVALLASALYAGKAGGIVDKFTSSKGLGKATGVLSGFGEGYKKLGSKITGLVSKVADKAKGLLHKGAETVEEVAGEFAEEL